MVGGQASWLVRNSRIRRVPAWPLLVAAALVGLGLFLLRFSFGATPLALPLDDAYIHSAFASHLARDHTWGLFAAQHSSGESSLLWPWLLAPAELGGLHWAPQWALMLGALAFLPLPFLCASLASTRTRALLLGLGLAFCGPLLSLALSGMESLPALSLGLASLLRYRRGDLRGAGLFAAGAVFLRPDALFLLGALALVSLCSEGVRPAANSPIPAPRRTQRLRSLLPGALLAMSALLLLFALQGFQAPTTLEGRRWLMGLPVELSWHTLGASAPRLLQEWLHALGADFGLGRVVFTHPGSYLTLLHQLWKFVFPLTLLAGFLAWSRRWREERSGPLTVLLVWTLSSLLFYALLLPTRGHLGRYQPQLYPLLFFFAIEGVVFLRRLPRGGRWIAGAASVLLVAGLLASTVEQSGLWCAAVRHLERVHLRAASSLATILPRDAHLAVFDVGAVAYEDRGPMIDLSGLSDPEIARALSSASDGSVRRILQRRGATHLLLPVLRDGASDGLDWRLGLRSPGKLRLEEIRRWESPLAAWGPAFAYTGNAFRQLVLYRLRWVD